MARLGYDTSANRPPREKIDRWTSLDRFQSSFGLLPENGYLVMALDRCYFWSWRVAATAFTVRKQGFLCPRSRCHCKLCSTVEGLGLAVEGFGSAEEEFLDVWLVVKLGTWLGRLA